MSLFHVPTVIEHFEPPLFAEGAVTADNPWGMSAAYLEAAVWQVDHLLTALALAGYDPRWIGFGLGGEAPGTLAVADLPGRTIYTSSEHVPAAAWAHGATGGIAFGLEGRFFDGIGHAMALPTGAGWEIASDPFTGQTHVVFTTSDGSVDEDNLVYRLDASIDAFIDALVEVMVARWEMGVSPDEQGHGLLWLFTSSLWWPAEEDDEPWPATARALRRIGEEAREAGDPERFLRDQIGTREDGSNNLEAVLFAEQGKRVRARTRARSFQRILMRHAKKGYGPPPPDNLETSVQWLGYFHVLMLLSEAQILLPDGISEGAAFDEYEPLWATMPADDEVVLELHGDAVAGMKRPAPPIGEAPPIEKCFAWEYVPADADNPQARLIIVALHGVEVWTDLPDEVEPLVVRTMDPDRVPPWGQPIDLPSFLQPYVISYEPPTAPLVIAGVPADKQTWPDVNKPPTVLVEPEPGGSVRLRLFSAFDNQSGPEYELLVEIEDPVLEGFRFEVDFLVVAARDDDAPPASFSKVWPFLRIWVTEATTVKSTEVTFPEGDVEVRRILNPPPERGSMAPAEEAATDVALWRLILGLDQAGNEAYATLPIGQFRFPPGMVGTTEYAYYVIPGQEPPLPAVEEPLDPHKLRWISTDMNGELEEDAVRSVEPESLEHEWTAVDWLTVLLDVAIGFIPIVGDVVDVGEFVLAAATGRDRYGRPIGDYDLILMGVGAAIPLASSSAVRAVVSKGPKLLPLWNPERVSISAATARELFDEAEEAVTTGTRSGLDETGTAIATLATKVMDELPVAQRTTVELADLLNDAGDGFHIPVLQHRYRAWKARTEAAARFVSAGTDVDVSPAAFIEHLKDAHAMSRCRKLLEELLGTEFWNAAADAPRAMVRYQKGASWGSLVGELFGGPKWVDMAAELRNLGESGIRTLLATRAAYTDQVADILKRYSPDETLAGLNEAAMRALIGNRYPTVQQLLDVMVRGVKMIQEEAARIGAHAPDILKVHGIETFIGDVVKRSGYEHGSRFEIRCLGALLNIPGIVAGNLRLQLPLVSSASDLMKHGPDIVHYVEKAGKIVAELYQAKALADIGSLTAERATNVLVKQLGSDLARMARQGWKLAGPGMDAGDESAVWDGAYTFLIDLNHILLTNEDPLGYLARFARDREGFDLDELEGLTDVEVLEFIADEMVRISREMADQVQSGLRAITTDAPLDAWQRGFFTDQLQEHMRALYDAPGAILTDITPQKLYDLDLFDGADLDEYADLEGDELLKKAAARLMGWSDDMVASMPELNLNILVVADGSPKGGIHLRDDLDTDLWDDIVEDGD